MLEKPQTSWWPKFYFFFTVLTSQKRLRWEIISPSSWPEWLEIGRLFRKMNNEKRSTKRCVKRCIKGCVKFCAKFYTKCCVKCKTGYNQAADGKLITPSLQRFSWVHWSWTAATKNNQFLKSNSFLTQVRSSSLTHSLIPVWHTWLIWLYEDDYDSMLVKNLL